MKRILALLIVCAMTSAASAAFVDIRVDGNPWDGGDVAPSSIVQVVLVDDVDNALRTQTGTLDASTINVSAGDNYSHTFYLTPSMGGWAFTPAGDGYTSIGSGVWFGGSLPVNDEVFVHEFHVPDGMEFSDEILIDYNIAYQFLTGQQGGVVLHVIPEPATIALLGIGALSLLRRRRKA